jgi:phosphoadenosine phosphosulfate reductase
MTEKLQKKVEQAIKLIQLAGADGEVVEVAYSGGKDSDVILELTRMAGIKYRAIYKNTTIDPVGTIKHCKDKGVEIVNPKKTFLQIIEEKGMPTRRARFCCEILKEYKILDTAIQGVRREESTARSKRYNENDPIICRTYGRKDIHAQIVLPILSWTNAEISKFISERQIQCHPLYYDEQGVFHVERRLGCMGCPLKSDNGLADYRKNPKLFNLVVKAVMTWFATHPNIKSRENFDTPYGYISHNLFYRSYADWKCDDENLFGRMDWKDYIEKKVGYKII